MFDFFTELGFSVATIAVAAISLVLGFVLRGRGSSDPDAPTLTVRCTQDSRGRWRGTVIGSDNKSSLMTCRSYGSRPELLADLSGDLGASVSVTASGDSQGEDSPA